MCGGREAQAYRISALAARSKKTFFPASVLVSIATERLPRLVDRWYDELPSEANGPTARPSSPFCGFSTLITSAPIADKCKLTIGPAKKFPQSSTVNPASGPHPLPGALPAAAALPCTQPPDESARRWSCVALQARGMPSKVAAPAEREHRDTCACHDISSTANWILQRSCSARVWRVRDHPRRHGRRRAGAGGRGASRSPACTGTTTTYTAVCVECVRMRCTGSLQ